MTSVPSTDTSRGRTQITPRALTRVVTAVAADALGVQHSQVSVDLATSAGSLDITVRTPIKALAGEPDSPAPHSPAAGDSGDGDSGDSDIQSRTDEAQQHVRATVAELTGLPLGGVTVRLTKSGLHLPGQTD